MGFMAHKGLDFKDVGDKGSGSGKGSGGDDGDDDKDKEDGEEDDGEKQGIYRQILWKPLLVLICILNM